jgi:hypothetical protein
MHTIGVASLLHGPLPCRLDDDSRTEEAIMGWLAAVAAAGAAVVFWPRKPLEEDVDTAVVGDDEASTPAPAEA